MGTDRRVAEPVAELELELKFGRTQDLIEAALRLTGSGRTALALVPICESKAERGYRLAAGKARAPVKASASGFVAALETDMLATAALRAVVAHGLDVLLANARALQGAHNTENVHQARVALRRMRSAIRLLDRKHDDFPQPLAKELRWAGQMLGAARDWDVMTGQTLPALLKAAPSELEAQMRNLLDSAVPQRDSARAAVAVALASARFARLALRAQAWTLKPAKKSRTLTRLAPRVLEKAHRALFGAAADFVELSVERRHRVRILAKRLRYALDIMSLTLPAESTARYIAALSDLQDVLGDLNDAAVAEAALDSWTSEGELRLRVQIWLRQRQQLRALEAEKRLRAMQSVSTPWRSPARE
jgi:CHAD domain-containing protein